MSKSLRAARATIAGLLVLIVPAARAFAQGGGGTMISQPPSSTNTAAPKLEHVATVFIVDAVEPCVSFWVDRFGFASANEVRGTDGKLIFASVKSGDIEVMYQTKASVLVDNPLLAPELAGHTASLYITVADIDAAERSAAGAPVVKPRHRTFYGSTELYVRDPAGNVIGFAQFEKPPTLEGPGRNF